MIRKAIKVDKKLDNLPTAPIFKKKYEDTKAFLATLKPHLKKTELSKLS